MNTVQETLSQLSVYEKKVNRQPKNEAERILFDIKDIIKSQTQNYERWEAIDTDPIDVTPILAKEGVEADEWIRNKGTLKRSEYDTLQWVVKEFEKLSETKPETSQPDKAKKLKIAKAKMKMLAIELELLKL